MASSDEIGSSRSSSRVSPLTEPRCLTSVRMAARTQPFLSVLIRIEAGSAPTVFEVLTCFLRSFSVVPMLIPDQAFPSQSLKSGIVNTCWGRNNVATKMDNIAKTLPSRRANVSQRDSRTRNDADGVNYWCGDYRATMRFEALQRYLQNHRRDLSCRNNVDYSAVKWRTAGSVSVMRAAITSRVSMFISPLGFLCASPGSRAPENLP